MISEYLLKGIDNIFSKNLATPHKPVNKSFNRETIKSNLHSVVKRTPKNEKRESPVEGNQLSKSRLRIIL